MPCDTRRCGGSASRSTWPSSALPLAGSAPISARSKVVLPAPLRPMSPHISPSFTLSEAPRTIGTGPMETERSATLSMRRSARAQMHAGYQFLHLGVAERRLRRAVSDDRAVVEGEHAIGEIRHDLHVVLNEQHGDLARLQRRHD